VSGGSNGQAGSTKRDAQHPGNEENGSKQSGKATEKK
jgi:hypothetical protein